MNKPIFYRDRTSSELKQEKIYYEKALRFFYNTPLGRFLGWVVAKIPLFSKLVGWWQALSISKKRIAPFIQEYGIDMSEVALNKEQFPSFDAFFSRKLKPNSRVLSEGVIIPADGRYLCYPDISKCDGFVVKGKFFSLEKLLQNSQLAQTYASGTLVIARLCPVDYHRFHFPYACTPGEVKLINGPLFSVNPIALKQNVEILTENKRMITELDHPHLGKVLFIEVGATGVGTVHQTYTPHQPVNKGDEKGYFSFGGSSLLLLFEPNRIELSSDLLTSSAKQIETLCRFGEPLAKVLNHIK